MACDADNKIILALPDIEELVILRKKYLKRKMPSLATNQHADNTKLGWFKTASSEAGLTIDWQTLNGQEHCEIFHELENQLNLAPLRLELGWLIANLWRVEGFRLLWSIPDPNIGMKESSRYFTEEARWRAWAVREPFSREGLL